jgi:hypothetical protein
MNDSYLEASQKELMQFSLDMTVGKLSDIEAAGWLKKHFSAE